MGSTIDIAGPASRSGSAARPLRASGEPSSDSREQTSHGVYSNCPIVKKRFTTNSKSLDIDHHTHLTSFERAGLIAGVIGPTCAKPLQG